MRILVIIMICAFITFTLRALPFFIWGRTDTIPKYVEYIGKRLPAAVMSILVVYCLKDVPHSAAADNIPLLISIIIVIILHRWKNNTIISVFAGTLLYIVWINLF